MSIQGTGEWEYLEAEGGELEALEWETPEWQSGEWESGEWETQEWETQEWESEGYEAEMELVTELLEVTSEQELEQFLGKLFRRTAKAVGGAIRSPVGRALTSTLKNVARKALPVAGGALGTLALPGVGGAIGSQVGSMASQMFEVELEGLNEQEAEYEVGKRFVRLATTAARHAARAPRSAPPRAVARAALVTAARRHAPGLLRGRPAGRRGRPPQRRQPGQRRPRRRPGQAVGGPWGYAGPAEDCQCGGEPPAYQDSDADDDGADAGSGGDAAAADADGGSGEVGSSSGRRGGQQTGRWIRRGRKIVIMGA